MICFSKKAIRATRITAAIAGRARPIAGAGTMSTAARAGMAMSAGISVRASPEKMRFMAISVSSRDVQAQPEEITQKICQIVGRSVARPMRDGTSGGLKIKP